tara:strand:- start:271 stop:510 length:240 start_codon:yes stop_codon:yes gene_type:complete
MTKFAVYYGVLRDSLEKEVIAFGSRSEIQNLKAQCKKDLVKKDICSKYMGLVLATDYGLVNQYKTVKPVATVKKVTKKG